MVIVVSSLLLLPYVTVALLFSLSKNFFSFSIVCGLLCLLELLSGAEIPDIDIFCQIQIRYHTILCRN